MLGLVVASTGQFAGAPHHPLLVDGQAWAVHVDDRQHFLDGPFEPAGLLGESWVTLSSVPSWLR